MTDELLPCPFCGGPARMCEGWGSGRRVACDNKTGLCLVDPVSAWWNSEYAARIAWNKRALFPEETKKNEETAND